MAASLSCTTTALMQAAPIIPPSLQLQHLKFRQECFEYGIKILSEAHHKEADKKSVELCITLLQGKAKKCSKETADTGAQILQERSIEIQICQTKFEQGRNLKLANIEKRENAYQLAKKSIYDIGIKAGQLEGEYVAEVKRYNAQCTADIKELTDEEKAKLIKQLETLKQLTSQRIALSTVLVQLMSEVGKINQELKELHREYDSSENNYEGKTFSVCLSQIVICIEELKKLTQHQNATRQAKRKTVDLRSSQAKKSKQEVPKEVPLDSILLDTFSPAAETFPEDSLHRYVLERPDLDWKTLYEILVPECLPEQIEGWPVTGLMINMQHPHTVSVLNKCGLSRHRINKKYNLLQLACVKRKDQNPEALEEILETILKARLPLNAPRNCAPLHIAAISGNAVAVRVLLNNREIQCNLSCSVNGYTALHYAVMHEYQNETDPESAVHVLAAFEDLYVARSKQGLECPNFTYLTPDHGQTFLHVAGEYLALNSIKWYLERMEKSTIKGFKELFNQKDRDGYYFEQLMLSTLAQEQEPSNKLISRSGVLLDQIREQRLKLAKEKQ